MKSTHALLLCSLMGIATLISGSSNQMDEVARAKQSCQKAAQELQSSQASYNGAVWELAATKALKQAWGSHFKEEQAKLIQKILSETEISTLSEVVSSNTARNLLNEEAKGIQEICQASNDPKIKEAFALLGYNETNPNEPGIHKVRISDEFGCSIDGTITLDLQSNFDTQETAGSIAHELTHHRKGHLIKIFCLKRLKNNQLSNNSWSPFKAFFLEKTFHEILRSCEREADIFASLDFGRDVCKWQIESHNPYTSPIKFFNNVVLFFIVSNLQFATHPSDLERIDYLSKILTIMTPQKTKPELYQHRTRAELLNIFKR